MHRVAAAAADEEAPRDLLQTHLHALRRGRDSGLRCHTARSPLSSELRRWKVGVFLLEDPQNGWIRGHDGPSPRLLNSTRSFGDALHRSAEERACRWRGGVRTNTPGAGGPLTDSVRCAIVVS